MAKLRALAEGGGVEDRITTGNDDSDTHAIYFNRGIAGSQAYTRKLGNRRPDQVPDCEAWRWLSSGFSEAILDFIGKAQGPINAASRRGLIKELCSKRLLSRVLRVQTSKLFTMRGR